MSRCAAIATTFALVLSVLVGPPPSAAFQAADGLATRCQPTRIAPVPWSLKNADGETTGWVDWATFPDRGAEGPGGAFVVTAAMAWVCEADAIETFGPCHPCMTARLYRDNAFNPIRPDPSVEPEWVDQAKVPSYFQCEGPATWNGQCGSWGAHAWTFVCNRLTPGRYMLVAEWGAGDDGSCRVMRWASIVMHVTSG
jgi:hypothetical protein